MLPSLIRNKNDMLANVVPPSIRPALRARRFATALVGASAGMLLLIAAASPLRAQGTQTPPDTTKKPTRLDPVTITSTRTPKDVFDTPQPVSVIDSATLRERQPNTAVDLFRELPGLDVTSTGTNQTRPTIRGQRGQRILLLEDGIRLNNSRRQQDFGEIPAIAGVEDIDHVEIVRGPASVLYGTDAIGGVVNMITDGVLPAGATSGLHGRLGYRYSTDDAQRRPSGAIEQRIDRFAYRLSGEYRNARSYDAPAGTFGSLTLPSRARVNDSGVEDQHYSGLVAFDVTATQRLWAKAERYQARNAGFGFLDPDIFGADQPRIQIRYPSQTVNRYLLGYRSTALASALADRMEVTGYYTGNRRTLDLDVFVPFGGPTPPGAGVQANTANFTDLQTYGLRAEATKTIAGRHLLTYGADFFRDRSENTDSSTTTVVGFGPPQSRISSMPQVPNATFRSAGVFVQGDLRVLDRLSMIIGGRLQDVQADTRATPGLTAPAEGSHDRTAVGTASVLYRLTRGLNLVGSAGRGFRSPNLVERFFNGPTPEGSGYQVSNPSLLPETSLNVDVGARVHAGTFFAEGFVFRNTIRDGIRTVATGDSVNGVPSFRNINLDRLRYTGGELLAGATLADRLSLTGNYSHITSKNLGDPTIPIGDTYSNKVVGELGYRHPGNRFWAAYTVRHNGEQKDVQVGASPLGPVLPAFTVQTLRGGATLLERGGIRHSVALAVDNLGNRLYAEFANASFFRPEPGRSLMLSYRMDF